MKHDFLLGLHQFNVNCLGFKSELAMGFPEGCMMHHTDFVEMTAPLCLASLGVLWVGRNGGAMHLSDFVRVFIAKCT